MKLLKYGMPQRWGADQGISPVQVCGDLLASDSQSDAALLYAASTLRNKIRKQLQSLPQGAWSGLRETLVKCINTHSANQPVSTQLSIAMSALILQWTQWEAVLPFIGEVASSQL